VRCGVLALQGNWQAHALILEALGVRAFPVRTIDDLAQCDAVVLPGGESTAMLRLMERDNLVSRLAERITEGMPTLATCAGVILLAREVRPPQPSLSALDVAVERNAYGRQVDSVVRPIRLAAVVPGEATMEGVFIRAPRIVSTGRGVEILAWRDEDPALVRQGAILAAVFHPELTDDHRVHTLFLDA